MSRSANAAVILALCSDLCVSGDAAPLTPEEWGTLAGRLLAEGLKPEDLPGLSRLDLGGRLRMPGADADRLLRLLDREASLSFELSRLENTGICAVTRADPEYPARLKAVLGNGCPPVLYAAGALSLLRYRYVGVVGSAPALPEDLQFTERVVSEIAAQGYGVVSGGGEGIETAAVERALAAGMPAVEYRSGAMLRRLQKGAAVRAVSGGALLLLSAVRPDAGIETAAALQRNRYLYAQSCGVVVVNAEPESGAVWAGAMENLQHGWCREFCRAGDLRPGVRSLIGAGALPVEMG